MISLSRINFYCSIFALFSALGHQNTTQSQPHKTAQNFFKMAEQVVAETKQNTEPESDEGSDKDHVFINKKIDAPKEFDEIKKRIPIQTNMGQAIWADRIENPIKNSDVLEERQKVIAFLSKNPDLLEELKLILAAITPEIEQTLLEYTEGEGLSDKKLYCQKFIPASIANIINKSPFWLSLWQVVPHSVGFFITLFDPIGHWSGVSDCSHGHNHGDKKKTAWEALNKFYKKLTLTKVLSSISLIKTTGEGFYNLYYYCIEVHKGYKKLLKKAHALQIIIAATEQINQIVKDNQSLTPIKQSYFEKNMQTVACSIKGTRNFGKLAQLQYFLSNKKTRTDLQKMLYFTGKADLYVSLATALLENNITLCSYEKESNVSLMIKQGVGSKQSAQKVPNDFLYIKTPTIITGPGGSGKSEYLAMIIANAISAQSLAVIPQMGNSECIITPLDYIISHSNITDTRGVLSTSQAEAQRLKQYNDYLKSNPEAKGIIVFDELLKHSEPETASNALIALVSFFKQYPQLIALYSTHFKALSEMKNTQQLSTQVIQTEKEDVFTYKIVSGANNSCSIIAQLSNALGEKFAPLNKNQ